MAVSPALKKAAHRVAEALEDYARDQGWSAGDYRVYYRIKPKWDRIHFVFAARGFENRDYYESYITVHDYIEKKLSDDPGLLDSVGLVIRGLREVEEGQAYGTDPESGGFSRV